MPAPVECRAIVKIQDFEGTYRQRQPSTIVTISCKTCPLDREVFKADARNFSNPSSVVIRNAGEFLARRCGLKVSREAVILPQGL